MNENNIVNPFMMRALQEGVANLLVKGPAMQSHMFTDWSPRQTDEINSGNKAKAKTVINENLSKSKTNFHVTKDRDSFENCDSHKTIKYEADEGKSKKSAQEMVQVEQSTKHTLVVFYHNYNKSSSQQAMKNRVKS